LNLRCKSKKLDFKALENRDFTLVGSDIVEEVSTNMLRVLDVLDDRV
jgi:hypothetical protein